MTSQHLVLSAKFQYYLFNKGLLIPLLEEYNKFMENQNYPFQMKEKNIAMQAVLKPMIDRYFEMNFKGKKTKVTAKEMVEMAQKIVDELYPKHRPRTPKEQAIKDMKDMKIDAIKRAKKEIAQAKKIK